MAGRARLGGAGAVLLVGARVPQGRHGLGLPVGLVMDVADASLMGQHTLAYVLLAVFRRLVAVAARAVVPAVAAGVADPAAAAGRAPGAVRRRHAAGAIPGILYFLWPLVGALLWCR